jgi:hypothetical protein
MTVSFTFQTAIFKPTITIGSRRWPLLVVKIIENKNILGFKTGLNFYNPDYEYRFIIV